MISAIPNQPINFGPSLLDGCLCGDIEPPLLFDPDSDTLRFQVGVQTCPNAQSFIDNTDFQGVNWKAGLAWVLGPGIACGQGIAGASLEDSGFSPTPGEVYVLVFNVTSVTGTVSWSFGGASGVFGPQTTPSVHEFTITATNSGGLVVTLDTDESAICFEMIAAYPANRDLTVEIMSGGDVVAEFNTEDDAGSFAFYDGIIAANIALGGEEEIPSCFTVRVTNECGNLVTVLESQTLAVVSPGSCTLMLRACNDSEALGFAPEPLEMRVQATLTRPRWGYEVSQERRSNGRIMRHYADRSTAMELRIEMQSEWVHPFLSMLPVFGHVYVGQREVVVDPDGYEPLYGDVFDGTGGIVLTVRPKQELSRRVICDAEGPGCPKPPNLWVQWTGPNNDLIITQQNQAIELAN